MAGVTFKDVAKRYGDGLGHRGPQPRHPRPRVHGAGRPVRLRQVDRAADDRRPRGDHRRHASPIGDRVVNDLPPEGPRHGHGLPELRALPAHDRAREPRVRPEDPQDAEGRDGPAGRARRRRCSASPTCSTASPSSSPAASASASRSAAPSCASRRCSSSTSRSPTSTPSCACRCAPRSRSCSSACRPPRVYVTHDQIEAMTMGHRIAVMKDGKLQQVGTPLEVYEHAGQRLRRAVHRHAADELLRGHAGRRTARRSTRRRLPLPVPAEPARRRGGQGRTQGEGRHPAGEHPRAAAEPARGETAARARRSVEIVEPLGHEVIVHAPPRRRPARRPPRRPSHARDRRDDRTCVVELDALHLFDAATEQRAREPSDSQEPLDMKNLRLLLAAVVPLCARPAARCPSSAADERDRRLARLPRASEKAALREGGRPVQQGQRRQGHQGHDAGRALRRLRRQDHAPPCRAARGRTSSSSRRTASAAGSRPATPSSRIDFFLDDATKKRFIPTTMEAMTYRGHRLRPAARTTRSSRSSTTRSWCRRRRRPPASW